MNEQRIRVFRTSESPCGYYRDRLTSNLVLDPESPHLAAGYSAALANGFRRAGARLYRPACSGCRACIASRIEVAAFSPNRSQRRCLKRNLGLISTLEPASPNEELVALYQRYLSSRHAGGGMDDADDEDFRQFLLSPIADTRFLITRDSSGQVIACAVTDLVEDALSAVYTFFDPQWEASGLGTLSILRQIEAARRLSLRFLYLGYWIDGHPKMDYKRHFQPQQVLQVGGWRTLE